MKRLQYQPVAIETADILPGLQTGLIDAVPATPFFALAGQFNGRRRTCSTSSGRPSSAPAS
jgi:TRAP-type C4-dicarboxylate transport system substrate-binding protein